MTRRRKTYQKGSIQERQTRSGKVFVIRYRERTPEGKWRHRAETLHTHRLKDAEKILAEKVRPINNGVVAPSEIAFSDFVANQWTTYTEQSLKPSTKSVYESIQRKHLLPALGGLALTEITPVQVLDFLKTKSDLRPKTRKNLYLLLQKIFNLAVNLGYLSANPVVRVPKPKVEPEEKPTLTPKQVLLIAQKMPENLRALIHLLYLTGMRSGEALGLKWSDVDFDGSKLHIRRSVWHGKEQTPKSRKSIRAKHLGEGLKQVLRRHKELALYTQPDNYVFSNGAGKSWNPDDLRKRVLYPAMQKAGIERRTARAYGFHLFRHSAGSQIHETTGDLKQTQNFLGHSGIGVTGDVYVHLRPDTEFETVQKLEESYFQNELFSTVLKSDSAVPTGLAN